MQEGASVTPKKLAEFWATQSALTGTKPDGSKKPGRSAAFLIRPLGNKSGQTLLFLSFAMVSVATLKANPNAPTEAL